MLTGSLNSGQILVGSSANVGTGVTMSGDATLSNTGVLTIAPGAVTTTKTLTTNPGINRLIATDGVTGAGLSKFECSSTGQVLSWTVATGWACSAVSSIYTAPVTSVAGKNGAVTLASSDITDATSTNIPSTLVKRDSSGNFNAGTIDISDRFKINSANAISFPTTDSTTGASLAIGKSALANQDNLISNSYNNTAVGYYALGSTFLASTAINNTAIGAMTLQSNTGGNYNVALGANALAANTSGSSNTSSGYQSLFQNTTGSYNAAYGRSALGGNLTGSWNTAIGYGASQSSVIGKGNTITGYLAHSGGSASGDYNTIMGYSAFSGSTTGANNTAVGSNALLNVSTGSNNTALGSDVGKTTLTNGSGNILIGTSSAVDTPNNNTSNFLNIGNAIFATGITGTLGTPAGKIGVGISAPTARLHLPAGSASAGTAPLKFSSGTVMTTPEDGAIEYDGANLFFTLGSTRSQLTNQTGAYTTYSNVSSITGGSGGLIISAGGTNQNLSLSGTGTGTVNATSVMTITNSTASTSSNNGALVISGGLGVRGNINTGGGIYSNGIIKSENSLQSALIYGGSGISTSLTLDSTSDAAKGNIILAPSDSKVGVGSSNPIRKFHIGLNTTSEDDGFYLQNIDASGASKLKIANDNSGAALIFTQYNSTSSKPNETWMHTEGASSPLIIGTNSTERIRISPSGNIGIGGVSSPTYLLQLSTDSAAKPGTSTWQIASDKRLKDIHAPFTRGLSALEKINPIYFNYKKGNPLNLPSEKEYVGIKAQDALVAVPEAVSQDDDGYYHVTNDSIIWTMFNAIKELYHKWMNDSKTLHRSIASVQIEKADKSETDLLRAENTYLKERVEKSEKENAAIKTYICNKDPQAAFCK